VERREREEEKEKKRKRRRRVRFDRKGSKAAVFPDAAAQ
jgi:hypothetical protein